MRIIKWTSLLLLASVVTGCASLAGESLFSGEKGRFLLSADAEGLRAYSEGLNGVITNGKASPDTDTSYWGLGRAKEVTKRMKYMAVKPPQKGE